MLLYSMKYFSRLFVLLTFVFPGFVFLGFIFSGFIFSGNALAIEEIDAVAIIVNENVISKNDIEQRLQNIRQQLQQQDKPLPPEKLLKKQVIERMIVDNIQLQMAKAQGIQIDDLSLNKALEGIAQSNRTTLENMRQVLQRRGVAFDAFREQTRKEMTIRQLQQRIIYSRVKVSQQEIDIFLEQQKQSGDTANDKYHLAHILIATPEAASPEEVTQALTKAEGVIAKLEGGESFSDAALRSSNGRNALKGGDLGWRGPAELPPLFLSAARSLEKDQHTKPLRSAGGFHILKLIDKKTQQHIVKQTHARHILIKADAITTDEDARKKLEQVKKRLDKGETFSKLAAEFSQDPGSKNNGGDLGWASPGSFVPRFTEVMNTLKNDQISEPFRSQFGWHIIQVLARRQQDETEQRIQQKAERALQNRKADEELQLWTRRIRDEAYVDYHIELDEDDN
ncbi:Periplasmic chaperone and peptidyl-prolyl cis-trans isomerase of outer membrane proteins SurA [hydrothermal vent metagenome]|uniref:Periplasmic chaperone and peptidyl-prolyl cis-trans isomerase of outer membrane proteins SurA n=1 Tax=hydrothermal vent metagenome TaxID=652676 RepID=A0A3B0Y4S6_9ZZZZ